MSTGALGPEDPLTSYRKTVSVVAFLRSWRPGPQLRSTGVTGGRRPHPFSHTVRVRLFVHTVLVISRRTGSGGVVPGVSVRSWRQVCVRRGNRCRPRRRGPHRDEGRRETGKHTTRTLERIQGISCRSRGLPTSRRLTPRIGVRGGRRLQGYPTLSPPTSNRFKRSRRPLQW